MTTGSAALQPLPQAPTAKVPIGMTQAAAARAAWQPNVFKWVSVWRLLVVAQGLAATIVADAGPASLATLQLATVYALLSVGIALLAPQLAHQRAVLVADLAVCVTLLAVATDPATFSLMALYSYSTVVGWAAGRPINAFVAGGVGATCYVVLGVAGPYSDARPAAFVSNLALYFFFALATSGFFTVARRIGALEVATEIARERGRYRRDLHDRLGQALCGLHFELQAVHACGPGVGIRERMASLADGYRDAGVMLGDLFRQADEPLVATNVATLIHQEARRMASQSGARIDVATEGEPSRIPPSMRPHLWSIAGECMTNALKNGLASGVDIELAITTDMVVLSVTDDGVGFDCPPGALPEKPGHYGLREMAERARLCGGEVVVASQPGYGTRVRLQVPLEARASDDIIERDAGTLRRNVWTLFNVLRLGLGLVALAQIVGAWGSLPSQPVAFLVAALIAADVAFVPLASSRIYRSLTRDARWLYVPVVVYVVAFAACMQAGIPPYFMLYAPLLLLAAAVNGGRRAASLMTLIFAGLMLLALAAVNSLVVIDAREVQTTFMYVTSTVIIGMSATQGAKLLDRLEALQIRVRYQALARLRQGLSTRLRDQLTERLNELEHTARQLAATPPSADDFVTATDRLQHGSSDVKTRLREIVHQLADPTPGRTAYTP